MEKSWKSILEFTRQTTCWAKKSRTKRSGAGQNNGIRPWCQQKQNLPSEINPKQSGSHSLFGLRRTNTQKKSAQKARLMIILDIMCNYLGYLHSKLLIQIWNLQARYVYSSNTESIHFQMKAVFTENDRLSRDVKI